MQARRLAHVSFDLASLWGKQSSRRPSALSGAVQAGLLRPSRTLHTTLCSSSSPNIFKIQQGKEKQAEENDQLERVLPQDVKRPKRSAKELAEAERRVKEHSRRCMRALRQFQKDQKRRRMLRCALEDTCQVGPAIPGKQRVQWSSLVEPIFRMWHPTNRNILEPATYH